MPTSAEMRTLVREIVIVVDAALKAADILATHQIVESRTYDRLVDLLKTAQEAATWLADNQHVNPPKLIFPALPLAIAFCEQNPQADPEVIYGIRADSGGRCSVGIFRLIGHL